MVDRGARQWRAAQKDSLWSTKRRVVSDLFILLVIAASCFPMAFGPQRKTPTSLVGKLSPMLWPMRFQFGRPAYWLYFSSAETDLRLTSPVMYLTATRKHLSRTWQRASRNISS